MHNVHNTPPGFLVVFHTHAADGGFSKRRRIGVWIRVAGQRRRGSIFVWRPDPPVTNHFSSFT